MKNEHAQFEKNKQHIEQVEKRNLMRAVADDHLTELGERQHCGDMAVLFDA